MLGGSISVDTLHDNASVHTANSVKQYLENKQNTMEIKVLPWPPQSADLNPIENIWAYLKKQLRKRAIQPRNHDELYAAIVEEWEAIPRRVLMNMVQSMPKRIAQVIKQKGGSTKY